MKDIKGFEERYAITETGKVWSYAKYRLGKTRKFHNGRFLVATRASTGYVVISFSHLDGKRKMLFVHRLVASAFLPNPLNLPQVNHKNGIKTDNHVENLEWCTAKENIHSALKRGSQFGAKGSKHHFAKLDESDISEIRKRFASGNESYGTLAKQFGVTPSAIGQIIRRISWKHVK